MIIGIILVLLVAGAWFVFAQTPGCSTDSDCSNCQRCLDGNCGSFCTGNDDCPGACRCAAGGDITVCTLSCSQDSDCKSGYVCEGGVCTAACTDDSQCSGCQVCSSGHCTIEMCGTDNDCKSGCLCNDGFCMQAECLDDSYCGQCEHCTDGLTCQSTTCQGDTDCSGVSGCTICSGGVCSVPECTSDSDCANCGSCVSGRCEADDSKCGNCQYCYFSDSGFWDCAQNHCLEGQCGSGCVCDDGNCWEGTCANDSDCTGTCQRCSGHSCTTACNVSGDCTSGCSCVAGNCQVPVPPSDGESCSHVTMTVSVSTACDNNTLTVTSSSTPLSGVSVWVTKFGSTKYSGTTDSSGQFRFTELDGTVDAYSHSFKSGGKCYDAPDKKTVTLNTTSQCTIAKPECTNDSDCPANYTCTNDKCVATTQPPPVTPPTPPECSDSSSCSSDKYCSGGSCVAVQSGTCGSILNHTWTNYECCFDGDCPTGFECKSNKCVEKEYNLAGQGGLVGGNSTITAYIDAQIYPNTDLRVTNPDGSSEVVTTDSNGQITLSLALAGNYTIDLMANGTVKKSLIIPAIPTGQEETGRLTLFDVLAQQSWLLLILLAVALFLAYRYFVSRKGKNK